MDGLSVKTCKKTRKVGSFPGLFTSFDTRDTTKLVKDQQIENQLFFLQKPQNTREKYTGFLTIFENRGFLFHTQTWNFQVRRVPYTKTKTLVAPKSFYHLYTALKFVQKFFSNLSTKCEGFFEKRVKREILAMRCWWWGGKWARFARNSEHYREDMSAWNFIVDG